MCGCEEKPCKCSFFFSTDTEAVDPLWIFKTTLSLLYLICNFCFHLLPFEIFSYTRLAEVSDGCRTSSWPFKSGRTGIESVGEHENTKIREKEISQIWHRGRKKVMIHDVWSALFACDGCWSGSSRKDLWQGDSKQAGIKQRLFRSVVGWSSGRKMTTEWTGKIRAALWMLPLLQMFWPTQPHALSFK